MSSTMLVLGPKLWVALAALTATAAAVARIGRLGHGRQIVVAAVRAAAQLTAVSLLIAAIVASLPATAGFVVLMCAVASGTAARRITSGTRAGGRRSRSSRGVSPWWRRCWPPASSPCAG